MKRLICWLVGHRWGQPNSATVTDGADVFLAAAVGQLCWRCGKYQVIHSWQLGAEANGP